MLITLDFETYYSKEFSLSKLTTERYIRDPQFEVILCGFKVGTAPAYWVDGPDVGAHLRNLDLEKHTLITHNAAFDGAILSWRYGVRPRMYVDTLSMSRPLTGQSVGGSLAKLATYFGIGQKGTEVLNALGKRRGDFTPQELAQYAAYCINDVELTYELYHKLLPYSTPQEMYLIDMMLRMYTDPVLVLDKPKLQDHLVKVLARKTALMAKIDQSIGRDALMSNPQFAKVLESLGVEPPRKTSPTTGKETWAFAKNDADFKALLDHPDEQVQTVVAARLGVKSTLEETRTQAFIGIAERGPMPILLNYWGAATGRASGGDGVNPQNMPRGGTLRYSMLAPPGHCVVAGDSSQIEARMLAWWAGQDDLVADFASGADVYCKFASAVYGRTITKADPVERFLGKTCIAQDSLVLTDKGLVPIQHVTTAHRLWDGVEWVSHDGVVDQGEKHVITYQGLTATADHGVFTLRGPVPLGVAASRLEDLISTGNAGQALRAGGATTGVSFAVQDFVDVQTSHQVRADRGADTGKVRVYDILNAGPRHRFTVSDKLVLNCTLGLGYGTGWKKLQVTLKQGKTPVHLDDREAKRVVDLYRDTYYKIPVLWRDADAALDRMRNGYEVELGVGVTLRCTDEGIHLPNRMIIRYPSLRLLDGEKVYDSRRGPVRIFGPKCVENVVQALARIIVFTQTARLDQWLRTLDTPDRRFRVVHSVHDEVVVVCPEDAVDEVTSRMDSELRWTPRWASGLPVLGEVHSGPSYGDCK